MKENRLFTEDHDEVAYVHRLQDAALRQLFAASGDSLLKGKLCGGTALERLWLHHRLSYDLDFFLPHGFDPVGLSMTFKSSGLKLEISDLIDGKNIANQLHGFLLIGRDRLKISFVEDAYFDLFPLISVTLGGVEIKSEPIGGLYHRKLRTVSGSAADGDVVVDGRQKARDPLIKSPEPDAPPGGMDGKAGNDVNSRSIDVISQRSRTPVRGMQQPGGLDQRIPGDLLDLFVLSKAHMPIMKFIASLPYEFPVDAFNNGLISMPWFDIQEELSEVICAKEWVEATNVDLLSRYLYGQIGVVDTEAGPGQNWPESSK